MIAILDYGSITNIISCDDLRIENMGDKLHVTAYGSADFGYERLTCFVITVLDDHGHELFSQEV